MLFSNDLYYDNPNNMNNNSATTTTNTSNNNGGGSNSGTTSTNSNYTHHHHNLNQQAHNHHNHHHHHQPHTQQQQQQHHHQHFNQISSSANQVLHANQTNTATINHQTQSLIQNVELKIFKNELNNYVTEIRKSQIENNELAERFKQLKRLATNLESDQQSILNNIQKQINVLCKRCEVTENILFKLNKCFNGNTSNSNFTFDNEYSRNNDDQLSEQEVVNSTYATSEISSPVENVKISSIASKTKLDELYDVSSIDVNDCKLCTTQDVANSLKEALLKYKISQQLFAETLLNMKQANLSALLSQSNTWQTLSQTNKNRYLTILLWLNDPLRVEKIDVLKLKINKEQTYEKPTKITNTNENKSKGLTLPIQTPTLPPSLPPAPQTQITNTVQQSSSSSSSTSSSVLISKNKRRRVVLSKYQIEQLKYSFNLNAYPNTDQIDALAKDLNLSSKKVANWFTYQRQQHKFVKINFI